MTTPQKQYQNISFAELMACAAHNPHRTRTLSSPMDRMAPANVEDIQQKNSLAPMGLDGYHAMSLDPTGILGVVSYLLRPMEYQYMATNDRVTHISAIATDLQGRIDAIKNTSLARKRKKLYELIGQAFNQTPMKNEDDAQLVYHGISELLPFHFILIRAASLGSASLGSASLEQEQGDNTEESKTTAKGDVFFSSEPVNWKREHTICVADEHGHWIAVSNDDDTPTPSWHTCLLQMEQLGWNIHWPEVDGTKTELVDQLKRYSSWKETDVKLLKSTLSVRLGKEQTLAFFVGMTAPSS